MHKKICPKCNQEKLLRDFRQRQRSEDNSKTRAYTNCKECEKKINLLMTQLRKENSLKPKKCQCCGIETSKLHLDHSHKNNTFRGWICNNCNIGISRLGDDIDGIIKAFNYLFKNTK